LADLVAGAKAQQLDWYGLQVMRPFGSGHDEGNRAIGHQTIIEQMQRPDNERRVLMIVNGDRALEHIGIAAWDGIGTEGNRDFS